MREVAEELRFQLDPSLLQPLGTFQADAANGDAEGISCTVFLRDWDPSWPHPEPDHEIAEYEWTPLATAANDPRQAPLLVHRVIPALRSRGLV